MESLTFEDLDPLDEPQLASTAAQPNSPMTADTQLTLSTTCLPTHNSSTAAFNPQAAAAAAVTHPLLASTENLAALETHLQFVAPHTPVVSRDVRVQPHSPPVTPSRNRVVERALRLARIETALYLRDLDASPSHPHVLASRDLDTSPSHPNALAGRDLDALPSHPGALASRDLDASPSRPNVLAGVGNPDLPLDASPSHPTNRLSDIREPPPPYHLPHLSRPASSPAHTYITNHIYLSTPPPQSREG